MSDEPTGSGRGRKEKKGGERKRERNSVKLTGHFFINSVHLPSLSHYIKTCHPEKISVCVRMYMCVCVCVWVCVCELIVAFILHLTFSLYIHMMIRRCNASVIWIKCVCVCVC